MRSGDATTDLDQNQLKNRIIDHVGVQADMLLPDGIAVDDPKTYGEGVLWQDTSRPQSNRHVTGRARIFLLGAAGEQEENGLGASASGPGARTLTQNVPLGSRVVSQKVNFWGQGNKEGSRRLPLGEERANILLLACCYQEGSLAVAIFMWRRWTPGSGARCSVTWLAR